jgi:hypothetical protein
MTTYLFAIDPGASGAIARFVDGEMVGVLDPVSKSLARPLADHLGEAAGDPANKVRVVVERVNGVPGQSGPGSFRFGQVYGEVLGVCVGLGIEPVTIAPSVWKPGIGLNKQFGESASAWKARSLDLARLHWPESDLFKRAKDEGRAEAALLGHYALTQGFLS